MQKNPALCLTVRDFSAKDTRKVENSEKSHLTSEKNITGNCRVKGGGTSEKSAVVSAWRAFGRLCAAVRVEAGGQTVSRRTFS